MKRVFVLVAFVAVILIAADAQAFYYNTHRITTADPGGADAELRESSQFSNRGGSTEIATRIDNRETSSWLRNSVTYLKFGVAGITAEELAGDITIRMHYLNKNIRKSRFEDAINPDTGEYYNGGVNTGLDYFVMDPTIAGADWDEMTITPDNAPAYAYDGNMGTKATMGGPFGTPTDGLTYLGQQLFDSADVVGSDPHLPVGGAFDFTVAPGSALHDAIVAAQGTAHQTVTIVWGIAHEAVGMSGNWLGFNYVFNSKEVTTLNDDSDSWWGGMSNANHDFSPALLLIPEPTTLALLGLGGLLLRRKR